MQKYIFPIMFLILTIFVVYNLDELTTEIADMLEGNTKVQVANTNEYSKSYDFNYVKLTDDFTPYSYREVVNIYFTVINSGWNTFTFYCPEEYSACHEDIKTISSDQPLLNNLNNFAHPFNSFKTIKTVVSESGEVFISIIKLYNNNSINKVNARVDEIFSEIFDDDMTDEEKIKEIHDYIINNTKYDEEKNRTGESRYESNTAYGVLFEGVGLCSGYSDTMAIFLERLNLKNFKIASDTHVWNAVLVDKDWYHVDLTWDDPVSPDGRDTLWHKYFMIKTDKFAVLDKKNETDHIFNTKIYSELK